MSYKGKIKILRIGTHPTDALNTVGYHAYWVNNNDQFSTTHISPKITGKPLKIKGEVKIIRFWFFNIPKPKKSNLLFKVAHDICRVASIAYFSLRTLSYIYDKDIVHLHSPMYIPIGLFAKLFNKKIYLTFHGEDFFVIRKSIMYKVSAKIFSAVFTLSPEIRSELEIIHRCPIIDVNNGVDLSRYRNFNNDRKNQILMVSSFKRQKGHIYMVKAFKEFIKYNKSYRLVLVGEGILKKEIKKYCDVNGISDQLVFTGYLKSEEIIDLYNNSEIFVLPSLWEGFPKVLLEALACGCKVITTKVDGALKVFDSDYRYFVDHSDVQALLKALLDIVADFEYYDLPTREIVKKYKWSDVSYPYVVQYKFDLKI
jgi:L-malate glycosyltransferase